LLLDIKLLTHYTKGTRGKIYLELLLETVVFFLTDAYKVTISFQFSFTVLCSLSLAIQYLALEDGSPYLTIAVKKLLL